MYLLMWAVLGVIWTSNILSYEIPTCTTPDSCAGLTTRQSEFLRSLNTPELLSRFIEITSPASLRGNCYTAQTSCLNASNSIGYRFGQVIRNLPPANRAHIYECVVRALVAGNVDTCFASMENPPEEAIRSARELKSAYVQHFVALQMCRENNVTCAENSTLGSQIYQAIAAGATASSPHVSPDSTTGSESSGGGGDGSESDGNGSGDVASDGSLLGHSGGSEEAGNVCPYVRATEANCTESPRDGFQVVEVPRSALPSHQAQELAQLGEDSTYLLVEAGPERGSGNPAHTIDLLAANHLLSGAISGLVAMAERPYIGDQIRRQIPEILSRCGYSGDQPTSNTPGIMIDNLEQLKSLYQGPSSQSSGGRPQYMENLQAAARELRRLDNLSRELLSDFVGAGGTIQEVMQRFGQQWANGNSGIVPCRSFSVILGSLGHTIESALDSEAQCESVFGVPLTSDNVSFASEPQILRCRKDTATLDECIRSCSVETRRDGVRHIEGAPHGDALLACMQPPGQDAEGNILLNSIGITTPSERGSSSYFVNSNPDPNSNWMEFRTTPAERCRIKEAVAANIVAASSLILAHHTELGQTIEVDEIEEPLYKFIQGDVSTWPASVQARVGVNYPERLLGEGNLAGFIGRICNEPAQTAQIVYSNPDILNDFMACDPTNPTLPVVEGQVSSSPADCRFIQRHADIICERQTQAMLDGVNAQVDAQLFGFMELGMDMAGCIGAAVGATQIVRGIGAGISAIGRTTVQSAQIDLFTHGASRAAASSIVRNIAAETSRQLGRGAVASIAHGQQLLAQTPIMAAFGAYGAGQIQAAREESLVALDDARGRCLTMAEDCADVGRLEQAYQRSLESDWRQIAYYTVIGAMVPGGRISSAELMQVSARIANLRNQLYSALQRVRRPISSAVTLQIERLRNLISRNQQILRRKFINFVGDDVIMVREESSGDFIPMRIENLTEADIEAMVNVARLDENQAARSSSGVEILSNDEVDALTIEPIAEGTRAGRARGRRQPQIRDMDVQLETQSAPIEISEGVDVNSSLPEEQLLNPNAPVRLVTDGSRSRRFYGPRLGEAPSPSAALDSPLPGPVHSDQIMDIAFPRRDQLRRSPYLAGRTRIPDTEGGSGVGISRSTVESRGPPEGYTSPRLDRVRDIALPETLGIDYPEHLSSEVRARSYISSTGRNPDRMAPLITSGDTQVYLYNDRAPPAGIVIGSPEHLEWLRSQSGTRVIKVYSYRNGSRSGGSAMASNDHMIHQIMEEGASTARLDGRPFIEVAPRLSNDGPHMQAGIFEQPFESGPTMEQLQEAVNEVVSSGNVTGRRNRIRYMEALDILEHNSVAIPNPRSSQADIIRLATETQARQTLRELGIEIPRNATRHDIIRQAAVARARRLLADNGFENPGEAQRFIDAGTSFYEDMHDPIMNFQRQVRTRDPNLIAVSNNVPNPDGSMDTVIIAGDMNRGKNLHLRVNRSGDQVSHTWVIID